MNKSIRIFTVGLLCFSLSSCDYYLEVGKLPPTPHSGSVSKQKPKKEKEVKYKKSDVNNLLDKALEFNDRNMSGKAEHTLTGLFYYGGGKYAYGSKETELKWYKNKLARVTGEITFEDKNIAGDKVNSLIVFSKEDTAQRYSKSDGELAKVAQGEFDYGPVNVKDVLGIFRDPYKVNSIDREDGNVTMDVVVPFRYLMDYVPMDKAYQCYLPAEITLSEKDYRLVSYSIDISELMKVFCEKKSLEYDNSKDYIYEVRNFKYDKNINRKEVERI